jgi:hypothetical protein
MSSNGDTKTWTFLTNHAQVLLCLAETPDIRLRDVAERVGITERATQRILADLTEAGYVKTERIAETTTQSTANTRCDIRPRSATRSTPCSPRSARAAFLYSGCVRIAGRARKPL